MNEPDVGLRIEAFVRQSFAIEAAIRASGEASTSSRAATSIPSAFELLAFIEDEFCVEVPDEELVSDEFTTIDGMARVLGRLA